jgi:hypothetical protein
MHRDDAATDGGTDYQTVRNEERGCGHLENDKAYLRSPPASASGHLPAFVEFTPPVPYHERDKFRGYEFFPGVQFELAVTGGLGVFEGAGYQADPTTPPELRSPEDVRDDTPHGVPSTESLTTTNPVGEVHRHIKRLALTPTDGSHAGEVPAFHSHDLYQHIGASYYPTPEEFIQEVREQGLSKAIPASASNDPPRINPGRTRLFLVHPNATDEDDPGVIGYVYLHRTIYTETASGDMPNWVQEEAAGRDDLEPVRVGPPVYEDGKRATELDGDEWTEIDDLDAADQREREESEAEAAERLLPEESSVSVRPSDKPGREVETVPEDEDAPEPLTDEEAEGLAESYGRELDATNHDTPPVEDDAVDDEETVEDDEEPAEDSQDSDDEEPVETPETDEETVEDDDLTVDVFYRAEVVEVPRPDNCPECGTPVSIGSMRTGEFGDVEVRVCRDGCEEWDNASAVNAALSELELRGDEYNDLRTKAASRGLNLGGTPSKDDLVNALLDDIGVQT